MSQAPIVGGGIQIILLDNVSDGWAQCHTPDVTEQNNERTNDSITTVPRAITYFKKDLVAVLWNLDCEVSFSWLVWQVKTGTSDNCRELNAVVKRVFVAVQSTVFQHTKTFHPFLSDTWWVDADVHEAWPQPLTLSVSSEQHATGMFTSYDCCRQTLTTWHQIKG